MAINDAQGEVSGVCPAHDCNLPRGHTSGIHDFGSPSPPESEKTGGQQEAQAASHSGFAAGRGGRTWEQEIECLRAALIQARPIVEYVSRGRSYVGDVYPDATARRVNAQIKEALDA